jgi:hypothetical protein
LSLSDAGIREHELTAKKTRLFDGNVIFSVHVSSTKHA